MTEHSPVAPVDIIGVDDFMDTNTTDGVSSSTEGDQWYGITSSVERSTYASLT